MKSYQPVQGQSTCVPCVSGKYNIETGSQFEDDCKLCDKGTSSDTIGATTDGTCLECDGGTYQTMRGQSTCIHCGAGRYGTVTGAFTEDIACIQCEPGKQDSFLLVSFVEQHH